MDFFLSLVLHGVLCASNAARNKCQLVVGVVSRLLAFRSSFAVYFETKL